MDTPNVIAAVTATQKGQDFDAEKLTISERWEVARRLGWTSKFSTAYLVEWCGGPAPKPASRDTRDYEGMILAKQEADESRWG